MTKRIYISALLLVITSLVAHAQYTSRLGRFRVDEIKGCAPFTITITDANLITTGECTPGKPCLMDYAGNGTQQQNLFTFTYTTPGTFKLSVLYQSIGADDITVTVDPNIEPAFEIYSCANSQVQIKITDKNYDQYSINFGDGSPVIQIPNSNNQTLNHTYASTGNRNISVRGRDINSANNCLTKVLPFTAIAVLPTPAITTLTAVDDSNIKLDFNNQTNILYRTEIAVNNAATFQQYQSLYAVNTLNVPNIRTDDNYYCFRLNSYDPCANTNTYSIPVCSHNFDLTIQSGVNRLTWQSGTTGVTNVEIQRGGTSFTILPGAPSSYNDLDVVCKRDYCYKVVNRYSNGARSISLEKCGTAFTTSSPTAINTVSSVVSDGSVALTWLQDPLFEPIDYNVLRSLNNGSYTSLERVTTPVFEDVNYTTDVKTCYKINYTDVCNNASQDGIVVCPMRLSGTVDNKNAITLRWSRYRGWINGVASYSIEKYSKNGALLQTINAGTDTTYLDNTLDLSNQIYQYKIIANPVSGGIRTSISNQIRLVKDPLLFAPTAFTPNMDNLNDGFNINGQFISKIEFSVFDRWGSLVYSTQSNEPWNGMRDGKLMPEATYVWIARITDQADQNFTKTGTVILLKKGR